jgi:hypothetical protein
VKIAPLFRGKKTSWFFMEKRWNFRKKVHVNVQLVKLHALVLEEDWQLYSTPSVTSRAVGLFFLDPGQALDVYFWIFRKDANIYFKYNVG